MNTHSTKNLLLNTLLSPEFALTLKPMEWELVLHLARQSKLVAYLGWKINKIAKSSHSIPENVFLHFEAAQRMLDNRNRLVLWELNRIRRETFDLKINTLVLKGGAYLLLKYPFAKTRLCADIDILVKRDDLSEMENRLKERGWKSTKLNDYDQQYYRKWMHEVPPMRHPDRYIEVDLHHTILPLTSRLSPPANLLIKDAIGIKESGCSVFSSIDLILHSSTHLFYDAELNASDLRDLVDLHELIILHKDEEGFFDSLVQRANSLNLQRPLFYSLLFSKKLLHTPVPDRYIEENNGRPGAIILRIMLFLVPMAILPRQIGKEEKKVLFARWLLYVRSHYLRMPLTLLIPHLFKKSKKRVDDLF